MSEVAFSPDELKDAVKDFVGTIVDADYGIEPLGIKGRADIKRREQLCIQIRTDAYEKDQFEWVAPSNKKKTKWAYFIEALAKTGALRDIEISGDTDEERMKSFANSLIGMKFRWMQIQGLESIAKGREIEMLLPEEYYGREEVSPVTEIAEEEIEL